MRFFTVIIITIMLFSCSSSDKEIVEKPKTEDIGHANKPKNIILLIGDGMGLSQVSSMFFLKKGPSSFSAFPVTGLLNTSSATHKITDSGAGATAFAIGEKTYNGAISVDTDSMPRTSIAEFAKQKGMKTGIISSSAVTHATPACFFAHVKDRDDQEKIAGQLVNSNVDYFAGGGLKYFNDREDGRNILEELQTSGYTIFTDELKPAGEKSGKFGFLLAPDGMPKMLDGRGDFLPKATKYAIDFLNNEKGFFLMAEASQIDWAGHANEGDYVLTEMEDFDKTIAEVLEWAKKDGETLVIVTADHETGGFAIAGDDSMEDYKNSLKPVFSTGGHTATLVPVFAFGPGAENFTGVYENTDIFHKMKAFIEK